MEAENGLRLLTASVCPLEKKHYFSVMYGEFQNGTFHIKHTAEPDKGPDQYAGQVFRDHLGRNILISWIPGWEYKGYAPKDVGCMSVPREIRLKDGKITAFPIKEVQHLLKEEDACLERTENGFIVRRNGREPVAYAGDIKDMKILRDAYVVEIFINGGEEVYSVLL